MPIFSFSTRKPEDAEMVRKLKKQCRDEGREFSFLVVKLLREEYGRQS